MPKVAPLQLALVRLNLELRMAGRRTAFKGRNFCRIGVGDKPLPVPRCCVGPGRRTSPVGWGTNAPGRGDIGTEVFIGCASPALEGNSFLLGEFCLGISG